MAFCFGTATSRSMYFFVRLIQCILRTVTSMSKGYVLRSNGGHAAFQQAFRMNIAKSQRASSITCTGACLVSGALALPMVVEILLAVACDRLFYASYPTTTPKLEELDGTERRCRTAVCISCKDSLFTHFRALGALLFRRYLSATQDVLEVLIQVFLCSKCRIGGL